MNLGVGKKGEVTEVALCCYFNVFVVGSTCVDFLIHWFQVP